MSNGVEEVDDKANKLGEDGGVDEIGVAAAAGELVVMVVGLVGAETGVTWFLA